MTPDHSLAADDRGVSEVIGYVLVVSLVITTVGVVSVSGIGVLQDAREAEQIENAKRAFDLLADNMEDVYREGAPSRSTEIQLGSAQLVAQQTTTINVSWENSTGDRFSKNLTLASITYRGDGGQRLVYDGGAVFRLSDPNGSGVALRNPPFVIGSERIVISVIRPTTQTTTSISGSTALIRAKRQGQSVLAYGAGYSNVTLNITSPHWQAWEQTLESRENVGCNSVASADKTECTLLPGAPNSNTFVFSLAETQILVDLTR